MNENIEQNMITNMLSTQAGNVVATYAETYSLGDAIGFSLSNSFKLVIEQIVAWLRESYGNS